VRARIDRLDWSGDCVGIPFLTDRWEEVHLPALMGSHLARALLRAHNRDRRRQAEPWAHVGMSHQEVSTL
jgi:hypothetical protein